MKFTNRIAFLLVFCFGGDFIRASSDKFSQRLEIGIDDYQNNKKVRRVINSIILKNKAIVNSILDTDFTPYSSEVVEQALKIFKNTYENNTQVKNQTEQNQDRSREELLKNMKNDL